MAFLPSTRPLILALIASIAFLGLPSAGSDAADAPQPAPGDFRAIIADASARVFPALIYVAPVVEEFRTGKREMREVGGSGVILTADGYAVTNWHVVEKSVSIRVLLSDGTFTTATKIGEDRETDIGLIRLDLPAGVREFPFAAMADSDKLQQGEFVLAMGAPYGLARSVSQGILSSTRRYLVGQSEYSLWLQTDASINPGNSGGPLVNTHGLVVGINTLGSSGGGGDMGFAVPSNMVRKIVEHLRATGKVERAWTGLRLQPLRDFSKNIVYEGREGVLVASVDQGSPAAVAGVQVGDLIVRLRGAPITGMFEEDLPAINTLLGDLPIGVEAALEVRRGPGTLALALAPRAKGAVEGQNLELKRWNLTVKAINEFENPALAHYVKEGVYVQGLRRSGNADQAGLRRGDILVTVAGSPIKTIEELRKLYEAEIGSEKGEKKVLLEILRSGVKQFIVLDYAVRYED